MIPASSMFGLIYALVDSIVSPDEGDTVRSVSDARELLADFAGHHDLSMQDFATLLRVAAGEAPMCAPGRP